MKKNNKKKQKRKEQILDLAIEAKTKINQNRILISQIDNYINHIKMIKAFINKYSENNNTLTENISNKYNNKYIKNEFNDYYQKLKLSVENLRETTKKLKQKYETNTDFYFDDNEGDNLNYKQIQVDAFILSYSLEQKLNIIKKLKESVHFSRDYNIFREPKRETLVNIRYGEDYIDDINQELQRYALYEIKQFNKYYNRCQKKIKKIKNYKQKIILFKQIINYFKNINDDKTKNNKTISSNNYINTTNNSKIIKNKKIINKKEYKSEKDNFYNTIHLNSYGNLYKDNLGDNFDDLNMYETDQTFNIGKNMNNNLLTLTNIDSKNETKKNKKINLPTVEELFDLTNNEGEKEAIIDDELHSDEETVFETKIKPKKKIIIDYLPKIKKEIPNLYLSQIEFNKSKVMNEADLYSYQRRQFQMQNIDENIKIMKKKIKIIKRRCKINEEKFEAIQNFAKECENDYNRFKSIKVQMSMKQKVNFMKKEFFNQHTKDVIDEEDELNYQKEMDDYLNDPELNDPYFEQYQNLQTDITHRQIEMENNRIKKISKDNINNDENDKKKYDYTRTHRERKKEKIKRANSK